MAMENLMGNKYSKYHEEVVAVDAYDVRDYEGELAAAPQNAEVGSELWFENDHVRIWEVRIEPGERAPFHTHSLDYFWVVVDPSRAVVQFADGTQRTVDYRVGEVDFSELPVPAVHSVENIGESVLRSVAVEFKVPWRTHR
jgi:quercetin dioxygenase-like cupin family protein